MTDRKYSMKMEKQFKSKRTGTLLVAIVLLIGIVTVSIQYFNFVSQTVYHESVSHLTEIFHQSNSALNELVNKNLYIFICGVNIYRILQVKVKFVIA